MPPVQKITREKVLNAAFELLRAEGIENINARGLAKAMGCSTQPIFSVYENMGELKAELIELADQKYLPYFNAIPRDQTFILNAGIHYVGFALDEPHLFRFLFMSDNPSSQRLMDFIGESDDSHQRGRRASLHIALYAHGLATMLIDNKLSATRQEVKEMLSEVFHSLTRVEPETTRMRRKGT